MRSWIVLALATLSLAGCISTSSPPTVVVPPGATVVCPNGTTATPSGGGYRC